MRRIFFALAVAFVLVGCDLTPPDTTSNTKTYTVIYHGNGNTYGFPPTDNTQYTSGMEATVLGKGTLEKTGYTFQDWNTESQGTGTSYAGGDKIKISNANVFLYAMWAETAKYTVSFKSNDGSFVQSIENIISGSKINKPVDPTKANFEFLGWFIDEQLEIEWGFENDVVTGNIMLYAKWGPIIPKDITITGAYYNESDNRYEIRFNSLNDNTINHIEVFIDGKLYYNDIPSTYIGVYLYGVTNGSIVVIKTVNKLGIYSPGVSHVITGIPDTPVLSGSINIMGIPQVGETLTANTYNLGGVGDITYQWTRGESTQIGTNSSTYTITSGDVGYAIKVTVNRDGYNGWITSQPTAVVSWPLSIPIKAVVSAGGNHSLVLKSDGTVWVVGNNQYGQLGTGDNVNRTNFVQVASGVASVSAGENHNLILKTDGTVWAMGNNVFGQLGTNDDTNRNNFIQVANGVTSISAGRYNSIIIKLDGTAWDTGAYSHDSEYSWKYFAQITSDVIAISAGGSHSLILKADGTVWASGLNYNGVLGTGDTTDRFNLIQVASDCKAIAAGYSHSLILKTNGTVWATGNNEYGQLGSNDVIDRASFIQVATDVISISAGDRFSHILKTDGSIYATGRNTVGQLGIININTVIYARFQPLDIGNNNLTVSAGTRHSLLLKADGTVWATGNNEYGQLGIGNQPNSSVFAQVF